MSLNLKKPKKKKGKDGTNGKKKSSKNQEQSHEKTDDNGVETIDAVAEEDEAMELDEEDRLEEARLKADQRIRDEIARSKLKANSAAITKSNDTTQTAENQLGSAPEAQDPSHDEEDPEKTIPLARFNPMLAILKNTLYMLSHFTLFSTGNSLCHCHAIADILLFLPTPVLMNSYGGIYESGDKEYTLQSFYALALDKLDRYICLRDDDIHNHEWYDESESGSDEGDSGSDGSGSDTDSHSEEPESLDKLETEHEQLTIVEDPSDLVDVVATQLEQVE
jgi:hypothetical protein